MPAFILLPDVTLTPADVDELNAMLEAKLQAHVAAKYLYRRVIDSGTVQPSGTVDMGAAGKPSPAKPAFFPDGELQQADTWIAYDLTLRCKACGSAVEKCGGKFYCHSCERRAAHARGER